MFALTAWWPLCFTGPVLLFITYWEPTTVNGNLSGLSKLINIFSILFSMLGSIELHPCVRDAKCFRRH